MAVERFTIQSDGLINGVAYSANGSGVADVGAGRIDFAATFEPIPGTADSFVPLLSILIIPTVGFGRPWDGADNLLDLVDGFEFSQDATCDGVAVQAAGEFRRAGEQYLWRSQASGSVGIDAIVTVRPISAVMVPCGPGAMVETLTIPLVTSTATHDVTVVRRFAFARSASLRDLQIRDMTLMPFVDGAAAGVAIQADIRPFARARNRTDVPSAVPAHMVPVSDDSPLVTMTSVHAGGPIGLRGYHHVQLAIPAGTEDLCREFWRGALGIPEVEKPPVLAGRGGCWFRSASLEIHLGVEDDFRPAKKAHPGILVTDLDRLADRLSGMGYEVQWDADFPGYRRFYSWDLVGNRLEFLEDR